MPSHSNLEASGERARRWRIVVSDPSRRRTGDADFFGKAVVGGQPYKVRAYGNTSRNGERFLHWEPTAEELVTFERDKRAVMAINGAI